MPDLIGSIIEPAGSSGLAASTASLSTKQLLDWGAGQVIDTSEALKKALKGHLNTVLAAVILAGRASKPADRAIILDNLPPKAFEAFTKKNEWTPTVKECVFALDHAATKLAKLRGIERLPLTAQDFGQIVNNARYVLDNYADDAARVRYLEDVGSMAKLNKAREERDKLLAPAAQTLKAEERKAKYESAALQRPAKGKVELPLIGADTPAGPTLALALVRIGSDGAADLVDWASDDADVTKVVAALAKKWGVE